MKTRDKKNTAHNNKESRKTGGGMPDFRPVHPGFIFPKEQIEGLVNLYDSDSVDEVRDIQTSNDADDVNELIEYDEEIMEVPHLGEQSSRSEPAQSVLAAAIITTPRTGNEFCRKMGGKLADPSTKLSTPKAPKGAAEIAHNHAMMALKKRKAELEIESLEMQNRKSQAQLDLMKNVN